MSGHDVAPQVTPKSQIQQDTVSYPRAYRHALASATLSRCTPSTQQSHPAGPDQVQPPEGPVCWFTVSADGVVDLGADQKLDVVVMLVVSKKVMSLSAPGAGCLRHSSCVLFAVCGGKLHSGHERSCLSHVHALDAVPPRLERGSVVPHHGRCRDGRGNRRGHVTLWSCRWLQVNVTPYTLNPTLYTLNLKPYILQFPQLLDRRCSQNHDLARGDYPQRSVGGVQLLDARP